PCVGWGVLPLRDRVVPGSSVHASHAHCGVFVREEVSSMSTVEDSRAPDHSPAKLLAAARAALTDLARVDLDSVSGDGLNDLVVDLQRLRGTFQAAEARVLARWDGVQAWQPDGARNGAAWLGWKLRLPA